MPASATTPSDSPKRRGRPRRDPQASSSDPVDDILTAASRSIAEVGVAGTTMSRIAQESGLGQSSLYYYFRRKEEIVAALVARANLAPLELLESILNKGGGPDIQLFRFVAADVEALCELPFDINDIHRIAMRDPVEFTQYWKERDVLVRRLSSIIRRGIAEGQFRKIDPKTTALTILSSDEGIQNWYRLSRNKQPRSTGLQVAELLVAGLLADTGRLAEVKADSNAL